MFNFINCYKHFTVSRGSMAYVITFVNSILKFNFNTFTTKIK